MAAFAHVEHGLVRAIVAAAPTVGPASYLATFVDVSALTPEPAVGWTYDGKSFAAPTVAAAVKATTMSPLAFFARFTDAETSALHQAALGNAAVLGYLLSAAAAQVIDLADPRTKAGLDALVAAGLLTADRETAILAP